MTDPVQALRLGVRYRRESPLNDRVWRWVLLLTAGSLLVVAAGRLPSSWGGLRGWLLFLIAVPSWVLAVRLLLLDSRWPRFWRVWLLLSALAIPLSGDHLAGRVVVIGSGLVFLLARRYRPYRHLTSARRAKVFGLGLVAWIPMLAMATVPQPHGWLDGVVMHGAKAAVVLLWFFWLLSLVNLFLGMRLHFLRLKPKLAVAALLIALVPLTLAIALAVVGVYGALGGARASQARALLLEWAAAADDDPAAGRRVFGEPTRIDVDASVGSVPLWMTELGRAAQDGGWDPPDTVRYVVADDQVWLVRARGLPTPSAQLWVFPVGEGLVDHLSRLVQCDVSLHASDNVDVSGDGGLRVQVNTSSDAPKDTLESEGGEVLLQGHVAMPASPTASTTAGLWHRELYFGGATLDVDRLEEGRLRTRTAVIGLKVSLAGLVAQYLSEENQINRAVVIALLVLAVLFLLMEIVALFFGLRITTGITSAVQALHRGTERLARGELDTHIEIPNEDEFGDLAASFNEMTAAVKLGQEQALQRERLEQEILMARRIQERLLPREMPEMAGVQISGASLPSRYVGGDYFDFLSLPDGRLGIAVGDVTGKGIPAALLMATLQACLHGQAIHPSTVAEVVTRVNDLMTASTDSHMFATFVYAVLERDAGALTVTNAGHEPPILCRSDGTVERLRAGGLVLGMLPDQPYEEQQVTLHPGDVLVLYSDGITEAMGPVEEGLAVDRTDGRPPGSETLPELEEEIVDDTNFFGEQRLLDVIVSRATDRAEEIREAILRAVSAHTRDTPQSDDITLVVLKKT